MHHMQCKPSSKAFLFRLFCMGLLIGLPAHASSLGGDQGGLGSWKKLGETCKESATEYFSSRVTDGQEWEKDALSLHTELAQFAEVACGKEFLARPNDTKALQEFIRARDRIGSLLVKFSLSGEETRTFLVDSKKGLAKSMSYFPETKSRWKPCSRKLEEQLLKIKQSEDSVTRQVEKIGARCPMAAEYFASHKVKSKRFTATAAGSRISGSGKKKNFHKKESTVTGIQKKKGMNKK